jgi:hypothetical protein
MELQDSDTPGLSLMPFSVIPGLPSSGPGCEDGVALCSGPGHQPPLASSVACRVAPQFTATVDGSPQAPFEVPPDPLFVSGLLLRLFLAAMILVMVVGDLRTRNPNFSLHPISDPPGTQCLYL